MAKSKSRAARRAAATPPPPVETEAEKIARLRLLRIARERGLLPAPGTLGAPAPKGAPVRAVDAPEPVEALPKLHLENAPVCEKPRPPAPSRSDREARDLAQAWINRHGSKPIEAKPGLSANDLAILASSARRALGASEVAKLRAALGLA